VPAARLARRVGYRVTGLLGATLFAAASVFWIVRTGDRPEYAADYLPGMLLSGIGVGCLLPTLTGAGAASLPPTRFATGVAVITMGRQVGSALGVAILVAVLGAHPAGAADFHRGWVICLAGSVLTAGLLAMLGARRAPVAAPVPASPAAPAVSPAR
jgi:MFS family permease